MKQSRKDKEVVIISTTLKKQKQPFIFFVGETLTEHPFILTAAACFFCITTVSQEIGWLGAMIPTAILFICGLFAAEYVSAGVREESRRMMKNSMIVISGLFSLLFYNLLMTTKKPELVILNFGMILVVTVAVYMFAEKKISTRRLILLIFILGFLVRLAYIMAVSIQTKQHDAGSLEKMNGHLGYIGYLVYNSKLPEGDVRDVYQYYHPPLHHIIAAVWVRFQSAIGISQDDLWENIQILTLFYSSCCMILSYKIFRQLGLKGKGLIIAFAVVAFNPTFYILAGSINNDILSVTLMLGAVLNTLYWYKSRSIGRILCIAVCVGCAMMAKLSGWMVAPAIAFIFIYVFFKDIKSWKKYLGQYAAFLAVCVPLGLWWGIRNYITHKVPITYILALSESSEQYVGKIPVMKRIFDFNFSQFKDVGDQFTMYDGAYNEYNPLIALFKTSMFDELFTVHYYPQISGINTVLFWSAVVLGVVGFASMIYFFMNDSHDKLFGGVQKIFIGILYFTFMISYYVFCIKFPHVCTENIRYCVPVIVIGAYFVGRLAQHICYHGSEKTYTLRVVGFNLLLSVTALYSIMSVWVYDTVFMNK